MSSKKVSDEEWEEWLLFCEEWQQNKQKHKEESLLYSLFQKFQKLKKGERQ